LFASKDYARFERIFLKYKLDDPVNTRLVNYKLAAASDHDWELVPGK